jgi:hypothetical protein
MPIDPITGEEIEDDVIPAPAVAPVAPAPKVPSVAEYLAQKYNLGKRQELVDDADKFSVGDAIGAALAGASAGFQGKNAIEASNTAMDRANHAKANKIAQFDAGKKGAIEDVALQRESEKYNRDEDLLKREQDPTSQESKIAQEAAVKMGYKGDASKLTAQQFKTFSPAMEKIYKVESDAANRRALLQNKQANVSNVGRKKVDEDYAKDYNDWTSAGKSSLDKNLQSLIEARDALAEDPSLTGGLTGVFGDRLTADRVLKQRQKVQSAVQNSLKATLGAQFTEKEGERIMKNAYNEAASPEANMESLNALIQQLQTQGANNNAKSKYFEQNGTLTGFSAPGNRRTVVKTQTNKRTGEKRIVYNDGSTEIVSGDIADGGASGDF